MKKGWKRTIIAFGTIFVVLGTTTLMLPAILRGLGWHPHFEYDVFDLTGKKALVVTTSHGIRDESGKATGVYASEMTIPYYAFLDSGMTVDVD